MDAPGLKRRLTCILAADAVGYSRHVSEDEEQALRVLAAHRAVIDGIIAFHDGRIFNTAGDSVVAEFHSVVDAVRCAVEMQDALKTRNESLPEAQRMLFRVGINLGEVVVKGDDLLGDGVNVAARLESVAPPGGIVVSSSVYDQITGKLDLGFLDIGEQALKNITRPIRAYRIDGAGGNLRPADRPASAEAAAPAPSGSKRPLVVTAIVVGAIALGLAFATGLVRRPGDEDRAADRARLASAEQARADAEKRAADAALREAKARMEADAAALQAAAEREAAAVRAKAEADAAAIRARAAADAKNAKPAAAPAPVARPSSPAASSAPATTPPAPAATPAAVPAGAAVQAAAAPAVATAAIPSPAAPAPAPSPASPWDGRWSAQQRCEAVAKNAPFSREREIEVRGGEFVFEHGAAGQPGSATARGRPDASGTLVLTGSGTSPLPQSYGKVFDIRYEGRYEADRFVLLGTLGERRCRLVIARAR